MKSDICRANTYSLSSKNGNVASNRSYCQYRYIYSFCIQYVLMFRELYGHIMATLPHISFQAVHLRHGRSGHVEEADSVRKTSEAIGCYYPLCMNEIKRPTIIDVARAAKVDSSTVSRHAHRGKSVSPRMTTRIGIAIAEPRYEPNTLARSLRVGHSQTLGVLFNPVHNVFYGNAMRTIQIEARRGGFTVMLLKHQENAQLQQGRLASLKQSQIDGVILEPAAETKGARVRAILGLTPVVTLDRPLGSGVDSVILDNQMAGLGATDRLLWYQHRNILSVTAPYKLYQLHSRLKGPTEEIAAVGRRVKTIIWRDA